MLEKSLIIRAWARFRPTGKKTDVHESSGYASRKNVTDTFGQIFSREILSNIKLKLYDFAETDA